MKNKMLTAALLLASITGMAQAGIDTVRADATMNNATVYFGYGAELTHETKVKVDASTRTIVISQLSTSVDINSLQVSVPEDVALLSQRYTIYSPPVPVVQKNREVEKLEDSIRLLQVEISRIDNLVQTEQEILTKTGNMIEGTLNKLGDKTLSGDELLKLVDYYTARIENLKLSMYANRQLINQANLRIAEIRQRISQVTSVIPPRLRPYGQVMLQVMCRKAGEIPVQLSYYTNNAGWIALYDVRVNSKLNKVKMVYKASVTQTSGIDWKKTKLTLSTGTPNFGVVAPVLSPWYLQLYVPGVYTDLQRRAMMNNRAMNTIQSYENDEILKEEVVAQGYGTMKVKSLADSKVDPSNVQAFTSLTQGQLNTSFEIDLPYDIASDGQLNSVTIKDEEINCILKNYAVPRMDKEAYLLAEVADWQNLDLLPGEANIIMDDTYIGKSSIDPATTADTLNLSLGRDRRVVVKRNLVKELSNVKTSGGNTKQVFTWEMTVKNNKVTDVNLLLKDQYPLSTLKEVEVKLEDDGAAMVNAETGVLSWKIDLKPGESRKVRFSYSVKYPKDQRIVNLK